MAKIHEPIPNCLGRWPSPEEIDEFGPVGKTAMVAALVAGVYAALFGLCVLGFFFSAVLQRLLGLAPEHESWWAVVVHACAVAAGVLLLVAVLGCAILFFCRLQDPPPAP